MATSRHTIIRDPFLPLHVQFREHLLQLIESGELAVGERLATERQLAADWGVSLAPVRQAMLDLVKDGYLYRVRGRGTFVSGGKVEQKIALLGSFGDSLRAVGLEPDVRVVRLELSDPPAAVARALELPAGKHVLLERLALVEGEPVAALAAWLPAPRFAALLDMNLDGVSLYALLRREWRVEVARATAEIEVVRCNSRQAQLLRIGRSAPALRVAGVTFDGGGVAIEYSDVLYRADRFRFTLESVRGRADAQGAGRGREASNEETHLVSSGSSAPGVR